ncbi:MAG: dockerin type I repeat-containing protein, partial [Sodaliphilus sp.]|nr:dockerin type I repeat-containing protein [Bacteroidales bacterium]MDY4076688.1 dockerin type I repeat-containing protein [Sodaliphilus sp.]
AKVDFSHFEGEMPSLTDGFTYKMVVLTQVDENGGYIACPLHNIQEQSHRLIIGDVNSDGQLNVTDVTSLINYILGTAIFPTAACDLTADGQINVSDTTALINLILK